MEKVDWKVAADRAAIDDPRELVSLPGYHVRIRKYTVAGAAEVSAAQVKALASVRSQTLQELLKAVEPKPGEVRAESEGMSAIDKRELASRMLEHVTPEMMGNVEQKRKQLLFGVEGHDFDGEWTKPTPTWVEEVLERQDVAEEILALVGEKNVPLRRPPSGKSGTPPNGSSTEPGAAETEKGSQGSTGL